jgi:hypothetical protein
MVMTTATRVVTLVFRAVKSCLASQGWWSRPCRLGRGGIAAAEMRTCGKRWRGKGWQHDGVMRRRRSGEGCGGATQAEAGMGGWACGGVKGALGSEYEMIWMRNGCLDRNLS